MNSKNLKILLAVFVVLAAVASFDWWSKFLPLNKLTTAKTEVDFSKFSENSIDSFTIKKGTDEKKFTKGANGWLVNEKAATVSAMMEFFTELANLSVGALVSKNPENQGSFGMTEPNSTDLTFTQGKESSTFIIGNSGSNFTSFYAKKKDSANIYEVSGSLRDKLSLDLSYWQASSSATPSATPAK